MAGLEHRTGAEPEVRVWNPVEHSIEPDPRAVEIYADYHRHFRSLYTSTADIAHFLARQQRLGDDGNR